MTAPAKRPAHRPPTLPADCRRVTVNLTADAIATARRLGDGNLSEGVRRALELGGIQAVGAVNRREKR